MAILITTITAAPAAADHDDHEAGVVIVQAGDRDRVQVVYPPDADEDEIVAQVTAVAEAGGLEVADVDVQSNTAPDTLRARVSMPVTERTALLERRIDPEVIAAFAAADHTSEVFVSLPGGAEVIAGADPAQAVRGGDIPVGADAEVTFRLPTSFLTVPVAALLASVLLPFVALRWYGRRVERSDAPTTDRLHRLRRVGAIAPLITPVVLLAVLLVTGTLSWPIVLLAEVAPGWHPPLGLVTVLGAAGIFVPLLLALGSSVAALAPIDRRLRDTDQSTRDAVGSNLRVMVIMLVPLGVWLTARVVLADSAVGMLALLPVFVALMLVLGPFLMNVAMRARRLSDGPVRERILELCERERLQVRDVKLLDTRGGKVANAAISGVLPQLRYVYVSDHLLELLEDDELDAVVAHEIAHGKGHHVLRKTLAGLGAILAVSAVAAGSVYLLADELGRTALIVLLLLLPIASVGSLLLAHGVLGIRYEEQADDRAVEIVGSAAPLRQALEKLADANGLKRRTGWWWNVMQQHPGMAQRLERLEDEADPVSAADRG